MSWADDMVGMFSGDRQTGRGLQLCQMAGPNILQVGQMQVTSTNLRIASHLLTPICTKVAGTCHDGAALTDSSSYASALAAGDVVLAYQLDDSTFLVIERMVSV